jgi:tRNA threonylcarbamoyladenosine biosynthesis protein TsaB
MATKAEPLILAIESATRAGSVCLARGSHTLAALSGNESLSHSTDLIANLEELMRGQNVTVRDVDLFAGASGPGSFTGLRIGLATIKSLAVSARRKCAGISTLAAIAHAVRSSGRTVAILPAGRGEVFAQMFMVDGNEVWPLDDAAHLAPRAAREKYQSLKNVIWTGDAATLDQIEQAREENWPVDWIVKPAMDTLAISVAALALRELASGNVVTPEELRATYLRASDAEIKQPNQPKPAALIPTKHEN